MNPDRDGEPDGIPTAAEGPWVAAGLSALAPGLGQIYNDEIEKGVFLLVLSYPLFLLASLLPPMFGLPLFWPDLWIIVFLGAALIAFAAADAFAGARRFNRVHASRPVS